jgi:hypothetical protein
MSIAKKNKKRKEFLYDVADVSAGYDYWFYKLLNYCLGIYKYTGLPKSLPAREILVNLIMTGHAVIFQDKGALVTTKTVLYDFDLYYRPTRATYGNVKIFSRQLKLGIDSEVVYLNRIEGNILTNQAVDSGLKTFILRYARQLADLESTANIYAVNMRATSFPVAADDITREQIENFYNKMILGERAVIADNLIIECFRNVPIAESRMRDTLNDILIARDKILENFFRDIGIKFRQEQKKAQLTEDEVEADEQLLVIDVAQMREVQQEGFDRVNDLFGTNIKVEINPLYDRNTYTNKMEVKPDDSKQDTVSA